MQHPFEAISANRRGLYFWPLLFITLSLSVVMSIIGRPLTSSAAPSGIVSFELAGDITLARQIIQSWDESARLYAAFSLGLDFLYLVLYSTTIGLGCIWVAAVSRARQWPWAGIGSPLAWGLWLAALLDAIENVALTLALLSVPVEPWPQIARGCAIGKFTLIVVGLVYVLFGTITYNIASLFRPREHAG